MHSLRTIRWPILGLCLPAMLLLVLACGCASGRRDRFHLVSKWGRFEQTFHSVMEYENPPQEAELLVTFRSPSGATREVYGFWDSARTWRVRFSPNEVGTWSYRTRCSNRHDLGLHDRSGKFLCSAATYLTPFDEHGPVQVSRDGRYLAHEDGTPFFWLADTGWNAALLSTPHEWNQYLAVRLHQRFSAIQWVATQWRAAPNGDRDGELAYSGKERIKINPTFFQKLDAKIEAANRVGLLNAPVLLWAIAGGSNPEINPGFSLPEDQAIILTRYIVARWGANDVLWILAGDSDYRGQKADRWKRIGQAVFGNRARAPVTLHPGGMQWYLPDFHEEQWLDIIGYQSGHGDNDQTLRWIFSGPASRDWNLQPPRPFINLEPPYENHIAYHSKKPHSSHSVRRALYWSLLNAPTAGVSYGGHGVWGWDDGSSPPTDHPSSGVPLPWQRALRMPVAEEMPHLAQLFTSIEYWRLRPAPQMIANQPGKENPGHFIAAARTERGDLALVYVPRAPNVELYLNLLPPGVEASWFNPVTGRPSPVVAVVSAETVQFALPSEEDWILVLKAGKQ